MAKVATLPREVIAEEHISDDPYETIRCASCNTSIFEGTTVAVFDYETGRWYYCDEDHNEEEAGV